jgi:hypothetical protein
MPAADRMVRARLRKLARQGRLVDTAFKEFQRAVFPGAPPDQVHTMRVCFFAGAAELHALINAGLDDGVADTDGDLEFMNQWVDEIEAFHRRTIAAMTAPKHRPN